MQFNQVVSTIQTEVLAVNIICLRSIWQLLMLTKLLPKYEQPQFDPSLFPQSALVEFESQAPTRQFLIGTWILGHNYQYGCPSTSVIIMMDLINMLHFSTKTVKV